MSSPPCWRTIQRSNFTNWKELLSFLELDESFFSQVLPSPRFPLNLPLRLAKKIAKNTLDDPLFRQFVPLIQEAQTSPTFSSDPVSDALFRKQKKLLHKYQGRALILCSSACAMHCRYCFRQNFDYETQNKLFKEEIDAIEKDLSLTEVLLSGGDPLSLSSSALEELIAALCNIPHLKRLRIHTRFPIGIPERIDTQLIEIFSSCRLQVIFVIHSNHPRELDQDVLDALKKILSLGIPLLSQTVLLKGVNDNVETLKELCERLIDHGILPYYLYQLDKVQGAAHFEVEEAQGRELIQQLRILLPGYGVPRYVREVPGEPYKTPL